MKNNFKPTKLYKFFNLKQNKRETLINKNIYFSTANSFNDPYDCYIGIDENKFYYYAFLNYLKDSKQSDILQDFLKNNPLYIESETILNQVQIYVLENKHLHKSLETIEKKVHQLYLCYIHEIEKLKSNIYVCCFSEEKPCSSISMWAYYADNHKGYCAEFDLSGYVHAFNKKERNDELAKLYFEHLYKVRYVDKLVNVNIEKLLRIGPENISNNAYMKALLIKAAQTKQSSWAKEKEWRIIFFKEEFESLKTTIKNELKFPFLNSIYFGVQISKYMSNKLLKFFNSFFIYRLVYHNNKPKLLIHQTNETLMHELKLRYSNRCENSNFFEEI
ncbi:MAG: DUF2971 domain-containing protein [Clostridia bacterium]|nr:DUF2971 domain-containing protein [Clostridia bacterium]